LGMNVFQKAAALILRIVGATLAVMGALGPAYIGLLKAIGRDAPAYPSERWAGSIFWGAGGLVLMFLSKPLGRLLGRGLD
jgi:hypothetical protein